MLGWVGLGKASLGWKDYEIIVIGNVIQDSTEQKSIEQSSLIRIA